jgi:PRTRC genetic system protein C
VPIQAKVMERQFVFSGRVIPDPNSSLSPEKVRDLLTLEYPEMATASIVGPENTGESLRYTIQRSIGSKG